MASTKATSLDKASAFSCRAARSCFAEDSCDSRLLIARLTFDWSSKTSWSRRVISASRSVAKAAWRLLHDWTSLALTSRSALTLTSKPCSRSCRRLSSVRIFFSSAAILSRSSRSTPFRPWLKAWAKDWTSDFSWRWLPRSASVFTLAAAALRQQESRRPFSASCISAKSSSRRRCSSSRVFCASWTQEAFSRLKASSCFESFSISPSRCCVRVDSSSVCFWTSSTSRRFVAFSERKVL
mmetsp:Transcript_63380/g.148327  ORF Transcript_63380/g.148327 Transcript_63380/m.148327 type:complete len:239 (-) Transcript_63380:406-1122(-)